MESSIINESQLPQLRQKVLRIQKETVKDFGESVKKVNEKLMQDYGAESMDVMTKVKQLLSGLNKQAKITSGNLKVSREKESINTTIENDTISNTATTGGAGLIVVEEYS